MSPANSDNGRVFVSQTRQAFHESLQHLEEQTMDGLGLVIEALDRAVEAVQFQDIELAQMVTADDDRIDGRYLEIHQALLSLLARQAPVATDLRLIAALLHTIRSIERMGDQCVNIAKLIPLSGYDAPKDKEMLDMIGRMGLLVRAEIEDTREAFATRNSEVAADLVRQDAEINHLNREIFRRAVEIGDNLDLREWGMFMVLAARALERIGDNAVEIAEQTVFVVSGLFREFTDVSHGGESRRTAG